MTAPDLNLPPYPIEVAFPDIACWQSGNGGLEYVYSFDSGAPGPHVMVNALTHGNEVCGAIVVDELLRSGIRPLCGRLTLAFANVAAYSRFDADDPDRARFVDEDFNRVWSTHVLEGSRQSVELARARAQLVANQIYKLDSMFAQAMEIGLAALPIITILSATRGKVMSALPNWMRSSAYFRPTSMAACATPTARAAVWMRARASRYSSGAHSIPASTVIWKLPATSHDGPLAAA
jgi:hypothetical protein